MKNRSACLEELLPLLCWENGCLVSKSGDITVGYELQLPPVFSLGADDFDRLHRMWVRALRSLPDETIVHKQDIYLERSLSLEDREGDSFLQQASNHFFNGRNYLQHNTLLYITQSSKKQMATTSLTAAICRRQLVCEELLDASHHRQFMDSAARFVHILSENGLTVRPLERDELIGTPDRSGWIEQYVSLDFNDRICLSDLHMEGKDFMVGDQYVSCFSLAELNQLPAEVASCRIHGRYSSGDTPFYVGSPFVLSLDLPFNHIYNQYFFLDNHQSTLAKVEKRGREQQSLSRISRENALNKEYNDQYLNEAVSSAKRSVRCAFNVLLWDNRYPRLLQKNAQVGSRLANMDCTGEKTERVVPQLFWAGIPGAASQYPSDMTFLTFLEQGCCLINEEGAATSMPSDFGLRLCDRLCGIPLRIDLSDYPREKGWIDNRNKFILGPSGSGKSFFTNHMVRQYYEQDTHVVIVDVGDSYQGLCRLIQEETDGKDGIYYTYTEEHPISFNPFAVKDRMYTIEKREQLCSLVFCLWKNENERITKAEETHIATAMNGFLTQVTQGGLHPDFNHFYQYLSDVFAREIRQAGVSREHFDLDNLLQVLRPYAAGGMYDYLLNADENLDLTGKRFIVFEIDNIKDHKTLFPVVTLVLMDTFISKMRHPALARQRKMILIEEAWKAISKQGTAEFIKYLYKTVRKHFGEAVVVTQDMEDIVGNAIVKDTIISNADCKILLDQRKYAHRFDEIQRVLALSDKEKAIALSVNRDIKTAGRRPYKEVFITLNGNLSAVYAVEVSPEEYACYTTEKREKTLLSELQHTCGSMRGAIARYCQ
ncbi:MAG: TraG family conjugative transposon ATPase [Paludibacteraceae bacterium]|nr:TraG family conjugative transposon ATPase [Paludibacteraceae bacterium]